MLILASLANEHEPTPATGEAALVALNLIRAVMVYSVRKWTPSPELDPDNAAQQRADLRSRW